MIARRLAGEVFESFSARDAASPIDRGDPPNLAVLVDGPDGLRVINAMPDPRHHFCRQYERMYPGSRAYPVDLFIRFPRQSS